MIQCQDCRRGRWPWRECPGALDWYAPSDIRFCPNQCIWLLENDYLLAEGQWPADPQNTGHYDTSRRKPSFKGAYFETPVGFHADITSRLSECGKDGILGQQHWIEGTDELTLAELLDVPVYKVRRRLRRVLSYISGYRRKKRSYNDFIQSYGPKHNRG